MIFIEWWIVARLFSLALLVAVGILGLWAVRKKTWGTRVPVQLVSAVVALMGTALFLFVLWGFHTGHIFSAPVYSPNRRMAVRIDDYSAGGLGGSYNSVELFMTHGLRSEVVFAGESNSVEPASLNWKNDGELEISYQGRSGSCVNTAQFTVRCIRK